MIFPEEGYAKRLHDALEQESKLRNMPFRFSRSGAGVNWRCEASWEGRAVRIHCFALNDEFEYYAEFQVDGQVSATARTSIHQDAIGSAFDWLEGKTVAHLHSKYACVDGQRRALQAVEASLITVVPELAETTRRMEPLLCDLCQLWFESGDRDVKVSFYGKSSVADFTFRWDKCELAKIRSEDLTMIGSAIAGWLVEHAAPAEMRSRFPAISLSKVADFYAAGRPVEGEFLESWDKMAAFFQRKEWPGKPNAVEFVATMRSAGYDHSLRAGQSLYSLIVSRSRRHGLKQGQACIQFWFSESSIKVIPEQLGNETEFQLEAPVLNPRMVQLLDRLVAIPID